MYPEILRIGSLSVHSYGLMIALAVLVCAYLVYGEARKCGMNPDHILEAVIVSSIAGLIGARLLYILLNWEYYSAQPPAAFFTQFEGLSFYGGFFGGAIILFFWSLRRKVDFLELVDLLSPYLALGYAFGRVGCFLNGCCFGRESSLPWALPAFAGDIVLRHPVQLYAALGAIVIFIILKLLRPQRPFPGFVLLALFALYGLLRFTTEFFRYGHPLWLGLTDAQLFSLALTFAALVTIALISQGMLAKRRKKMKKAKGK